jgi:hypothetical protein
MEGKLSLSAVTGFTRMGEKVQLANAQGAAAVCGGEPKK